MPGEPRSQVILVDTSAYFALVDRSDRHHAAAVSFVRSNALPLATTDLIVVETLNLTRARLGHSPAVRLGRRLLNLAVTTILKVAEQDATRAWQLFQRYRDKEFSFTDCTSFALMERMQITTAFAFDVHFRQYGRFTVVPK
ncbi:MAG TPA: PIN domain-containing protein [archaeon]|nr:PIN domain-containing protein [archaeon]